MQRRDLEIYGGTWKVEIQPDQSCFVYDPQGEKVHASRDHIATAVGLAFALATLRDMQMEMGD